MRKVEIYDTSPLITTSKLIDKGVFHQWIAGLEVGALIEKEDGTVVLFPYYCIKFIES